MAHVLMSEPGVIGTASHRFDYGAASLPLRVLLIRACASVRRAVATRHHGLSDSHFQLHPLQWVVRDLGEAFPGIEADPTVSGGEPCIVRTRRLGTSEADIL